MYDLQREASPRKSTGCSIWLWIVTAALFSFFLMWYMVRPGVFTIQPIGALPDGITLVYHSRNPEMAFFSSPDALCLELQGGVSLLCRAVALRAVEQLTDRVLFRLPYSHWMYLLSTGGLEFEN